ncbi:potassium channel protein [Flavobacterium sp. L1I52]|uniref:Potassium channel protein n=1 Tax=Flavobacterium pokkalii TaxID=1940408 RepID=A0ABR7UV94_9FLAO|nr:potassium channel family protein [Flavobacterium pokkalii]MBD0726292.1 potassium channel protein [Flavobacterium pokkalii]
MKKILRKLLLGNVTNLREPKLNPIQKRIQNIKAIWNNDHQDDNGIEKIVRLLLSTSQLIFPGIYIKYLASKKGTEYEDLAMDFYILLKVALPVIIITNQWQQFPVVLGLMVYVMLETVLYIPTLIFASDLFARPRSYKRSMLLLFFNYLEMILGFAVLYSTGEYLNKSFNNWFDAVYFSTVTSTTIGFGDLYPVQTFGKILVIIQSMLVLMFVVLFLNFYSTKIDSKGYFEKSKKD